VRLHCRSYFCGGSGLPYMVSSAHTSLFPKLAHLWFNRFRTIHSCAQHMKSHAFLWTGDPSIVPFAVGNLDFAITHGFLGVHKCVSSNWFMICLAFLPVWCYASAGIVMALCLCLSVTSRCSIEVVGRIELVFGVKSSTSPTLCFKEIRVSTKIKVLPSKIFF